jgi:hypothetical protein
MKYFGIPFSFVPVSFFKTIASIGIEGIVKTFQEQNRNPRFNAR